MDKKIAEGKSKLEAIRCLKRHLARRIWRLLYANTNQPTSPPKPPSQRPLQRSCPARPKPANSDRVLTQELQTDSAIRAGSSAEAIVRD
jgi:hypothetical protein